MSPQALRFAQGRILGETNTSWYVGEVTLENERRIMECISKLQRLCYDTVVTSI